MPLGYTEDKSIFIQVMYLYQHSQSYYLHRYWPRLMSPYDIIGSQWVVNRWIQYLICYSKWIVVASRPQVSGWSVWYIVRCLQCQQLMCNYTWWPLPAFECYSVLTFQYSKIFVECSLRYTLLHYNFGLMISPAVRVTIAKIFKKCPNW